MAVRNAQEVRSYHRRRTLRGDQQRENDLAMAMKRVKDAMKPLRSEIGKFPSQSPTQKNLDRQERIRAVSQALQRERRKLWKMMCRPSPERTP